MKLASSLFRSSLLALLACGALRAGEEPSFYLKGSLISAQGDLLSATKKGTSGYGGELGWVLPASDSNLSFTAHAGYLVIRGKEDAGLDAKAGSFGLDLGYSLPVNLTLKTGPVLHTWDVSDPKDPAGGAQGERSWKLGWRVGVDYRFHPRWVANVTYAFSEWRPGVNPSYLSFGAGYRF